MALLCCPECNKEISNKANICPNCGFRIVEFIKLDEMNQAKEKQIVCQFCGKHNEIGSLFCGYCGELIDELEIRRRIEVENFRNQIEGDEFQEDQKAIHQDQLKENMKIKKQHQKIQKDQLKERRLTRKQQPKKYKNIIAVIYLAIASMLLISITFSTPNFPASSKDILIERASDFIGLFICLILPMLFVLINPIRKYIPLFKKQKLFFTVIGWIVIFVIGVAMAVNIGAMHSDEYLTAKEKYDTELQLQDQTDLQQPTETED